MRFGTLWRMSVLASLALLMSGQLCMLTTCVPRLTPFHAARHACCRVVPLDRSPDHRVPSPGAMPCDQVMHATAAPVLALPLACSGFGPGAGALDATIAPNLLLAAPACVSAPRALADTGPPLGRPGPASAGLRAPPQG